MSSEQVCRFFLEGRCRFGARCRYSHETGRQAGGRGGGQTSNASFPEGRRGYGYDHREAGRDSNRFEHFNSGGGGERGRGGFGYSNRGGGYGNRGPGGDYSDRGGGYGNRGPGGDYSDRGGGYGNRGFRGGYSDRGGSYGFRGGYSNRGGSYGGYSDRGGSYGPSNTSSYGGSGGGYGNRGPSSSEPTSPEELAQVIREDMETWTKSQMWPFSCYSCQREGRCVPRFVDTSPEELRWKVYQARQDPAAQTAYHSELRSLHEQAMSARRELMAITPITAQSLPSGDGGTASSAISPSVLFQIAQNQPSIFGGVTDGSSKGSPSASLPVAPASLFAGPSGTAHTANGSLTRGYSSITEPATVPASSTQQTTTTVSSAVTTAHTLTEEELKAFKAEHFSLGKIPETPPPPEII